MAGQPDYVALGKSLKEAGDQFCEISETSQDDVQEITTRMIVMAQRQMRSFNYNQMNDQEELQPLSGPASNAGPIPVIFPPNKEGLYYNLGNPELTARLSTDVFQQLAPIAASASAFQDLSPGIDFEWGSLKFPCAEMRQSPFLRHWMVHYMPKLDRDL